MESLSLSPPPLPKTKLTGIKPGITILDPLSRRGEGPGLLVLVEESGVLGDASDTRIERGIPCPLMKWAEEGYTVVEITQISLEREPDALKLALAELAKSPVVVPKHAFGIICTATQLLGLLITKRSRPLTVSKSRLQPTSMEHGSL
jgi:carboxymethylenebutenolidase